jgi:hypothetical protein
MIKLPLPCPITDEEVRADATRTMIVMLPYPALIWWCPLCIDVHDQPLDVDVYDELAKLGYDFLAVL